MGVTSKSFLVAVLALGVTAFAFCAEGATTVVQPKVAGRVIESLPLHLILASMKKAEPPRVAGSELVLSVSGPYRSVAAAFAHEDFAILHPYERNRQGVFVLAYPVPLKWSGNIEYRVVIDGVWSVDPMAAETQLDHDSGVELSVARVPYLSDLHLGLHKILSEDGKTARFIFRGGKGESVTVCGDFDNWDPFILEMTETSPGVYELEMPLSPGTHYYNFIYRGEALTDPLNPDKAARRECGEVSVLTVPAAD